MCTFGYYFDSVRRIGAVVGLCLCVGVFGVIGGGVVYGQAGGAVSLAGTVGAPIPAGAAQSKVVVVSGVTAGAAVSYKKLGSVTCDSAAYTAGSGEVFVPLSGGIGFVMLAEESDNGMYLCFEISKTGETSVYAGSAEINGIDVTVPLVPTLLDLDQTDDSGLLHDDDVTNRTHGLTFTGCAEADASVQLYDSGVALDGAVGTATGDTCTNGADSAGKEFSLFTDLAGRNGAYALTAVASDAATNRSGPSEVLFVTVDTDVPTVSVQSVSGGYVTSEDGEDAVPVPIVVSGTGNPVRMSLTVRDSDTTTADIVKSDVADIAYGLRGELSDASDGLAAMALSDDDEFGAAVAVSGSVIFVGAPGDISGGTDSGAVYVFEDENNDGDFLESGEMRVINANTAGISLSAGDLFGSSLAVSDDGSVLYVGAPGDHTGGADRGAVYALKDSDGDRDYDGSGEVVKISDRTHGISLSDDDSFGSSVAVSGRMLAVGSRENSTGGFARGAVHILHDYNTDGAYDGTGEVIVLDSTQTGLTLSDRDHFGSAVAIDGLRIFVGAPGYDAEGLNTGRVFVFEDRNEDGDYDEDHEITVIGGQVLGTTLPVGGLFGSSFSLENSKIFVGAREQNGGGAVYILDDRDGDGDYTEAGNVTVLGGAHDDLTLGSSDLFGASVVSDGLTLFVGAPGDDAGGGEHGALYVFDGMFSTALSPAEMQSLTAGTVTVTATGQDIAGNISNEDSISFTYTTALFSTAGFGIDLDSADDTGSSSSDKKTRQASNLTFFGTLPLFVGQADAGTYRVQLYRNGKLVHGAVDQTFEGADSSWSVDLSLPTNRTHEIGMKLLDRDGNIRGNAATMVQIYTIAPTNSPGDITLTGPGANGPATTTQTITLSGTTDTTNTTAGDYITLYTADTEIPNHRHLFTADSATGTTPWTIALPASTLGTGTHTIVATYHNVYGTPSQTTTSTTVTVR